MDTLDAINLLKKYNLYEDAQSECKRQKLDNAPYDMQGHNKVYCQFLDRKRVELRNKADEKKKVVCTNRKALESHNSSHDDCFFNRITFAKLGYCEECDIGRELAKIEKEMDLLSEASKVLRDAAEYDYFCR